MILIKVNGQDFLCKRLFFKMYLYEDRAENRRGPSKAPKMTNICLNFTRTGVGPAKDKNPRKVTPKNPVVLLKLPMYMLTY